MPTQNFLEYELLITTLNFYKMTVIQKSYQVDTFTIIKVNIFCPGKFLLLDNKRKLLPKLNIKYTSILNLFLYPDAVASLKVFLVWELHSTTSEMQTFLFATACLLFPQLYWDIISI